MSQTFTVNALPMRTYRWLKMNRASLTRGDDAPFASLACEVIAQLPQGVTEQTDLSQDALDALFAADAARIREGDHAAIKPNGDAFVDSRQAIPSGMGLVVDTLMEHEQVQTTLYTIEAGARVSEPLLLRFSPPHKSCVLSRVVVHVKKGADVTILKDCYTHRTSAGFFGIQVYLLAEEDAHVRLGEVQMLGGGFTHFDDMGAVLHRRAFLELMRLEFGTETSFRGCAVNLLEDEARFSCEVGYLARRKQIYDFNYVTTHRGKKSESAMRFHGVLLDQSQKMLRGTIDFRAGASSSDGEENEDVLMLSERAINRTIPIILCQEENINGHHGATIGQLSDEMLFYMQSRGFSEDEAKKLMIRAKIMQVANRLPESDLKSHVNAYLCDTL